MKIVKMLIIIVILGFICLNLSTITSEIGDILDSEPTIQIPKENKYYKNVSYGYVQESSDFIPYGYQDLLNIFYSILNRGYDSFTFYCPDEYDNCLMDVADISKDNIILTNINNYTSPFNNFKSIKVMYSADGEVNVVVKKLYSDQEIMDVNQKIDEIISSIITNDMKPEDKILTIHDYIVNNTKYDLDKANNKSVYKSNIAYGPLIEKKAVCGGYADAMALFLNRLGVPNFKVAADNHIWNAVYIDGKWLHLDLTWDDPVTKDRDIDKIEHKFYLINTEKLESYKIEDHSYDKLIYQELS